MTRFSLWWSTVVVEPSVPEEIYEVCDGVCI